MPYFSQLVDEFNERRGSHRLKIHKQKVRSTSTIKKNIYSLCMRN